MTIGYLLIGHGTRNKAGCAEFLQLHAQVAAKLVTRPSEPAFLELAEPAIEAAMHKLKQSGVTQIICAPVILLAAGHVKQDIPAAVHAAAERVEIEAVEFVSHLGCRQALLELSQLRYEQARQDPLNTDSVGWVLVGRGTRDESALAELRQFQALRERQRPSSRQWLGFLAMATPKLEEVLELAGDSAVERVIVQPHLLFRGQLLEQTARLTAEFSRRFPSKKWQLAEHLGPHELLAESIARELLAATDRQTP